MCRKTRSSRHEPQTARRGCRSLLSLRHLLFLQQTSLPAPRKAFAGFPDPRNASGTVPGLYHASMLFPLCQRGRYMVRLFHRVDARECSRQDVHNRHSKNEAATSYSAGRIVGGPVSGSGTPESYLAYRRALLEPRIADLSLAVRSRVTQWTTSSTARADPGGYHAEGTGRDGEGSSQEGPYYRCVALDRNAASP